MIEKNSYKSNEEPFRIDFTILSDLSVIILGGINECLAAKWHVAFCKLGKKTQYAIKLTRST